MVLVYLKCSGAVPSLPLRMTLIFSLLRSFLSPDSLPPWFFVPRFGPLASSSTGACDISATEPPYPGITTNLSFGIASSVARSMLRWAITSSGGVWANHSDSDKS
jgi:hypothetical protein